MRSIHSIRDQLALESVAFQAPVFFQELTAAFEELQKATGDKTENPVVSRLSKIVAHHTGLDISFDIGEMEPCVDIPAINKNNVLVNSTIRNWVSSSDGLKMIDNGNSVIRGSVSILTGKVSGAYGDVKHTIHLPRHFFTLKKFTPGEIAAVTLHEIGHLFTYYEYMARTVSTNQVLAGVAKALDGTDSVHEREVILTRAKTQLKLKDLNVEALAKSNNKRVIEVVIVTQRVRQTESELGASLADMTSWEYLSDQYATRMGAGRELVTALEKIYRMYGDLSFRGSFQYVLVEALKLNFFIAGALLATTSFLAAFYFMMLGVLVIAADAKPDSYDQAGARFKRVRDQLVQRLKDKKISAEERKSLTDSLEAIDAISKQADDKRQLVGIIWDFLSPGAREARSQLLLQQQLEDLAANDLFTKAAELRQLA